MNRKNVLIFFAVLVLACVSIAGVTARAAQHNLPATATPAASGKKAEEQFKNIQVLKGIPAEQLFPTMQFVAASLGVHCEFCHVPNAFEKDDKKAKQTARKMMEMMFVINQENFDGRRDVTCYSCHRGNAIPIAIPAVMTEEQAKAESSQTRGPAAPPSKEDKRDSDPTGAQLLDKYIQALGGSPAIDRVTSRVMTGTIQFGDKSLLIDIYAKDPDMRISFTHMPEGDNITAFNGHEGWLAAPRRPPHFMQGSELDAASIDADLHLATHLKQMFSGMKVEGAEKVGDREAYVLVGERAGTTPIRLYFDEQSGLLLRLLRFGETALGWLPTEIDYADYREVGGVKVPYRWTLSRPSGIFTIQLTELKQNVPVDNAKFAKPEIPQGPPKTPAK